MNDHLIDDFSHQASTFLTNHSKLLSLNCLCVPSLLPLLVPTHGKLQYRLCFSESAAPRGTTTSKTKVGPVTGD